MAKSKQRRVVIFIVEGRSDEIVISGTLGKLLKSQDIYTDCFVYPVGGDITSDYGSAVNTIKSVLGKRVRDFINDSGYKYLPSDIQHIIQITDTDGVFVPDERILQMNDDEYNVHRKKTLYFDDHISAYNTNDIIDRNFRKSRNLNVLVRCHDIKMKDGDKSAHIPYSIYFFSCNIDHYLYDERNLSDNEKTDKAWDFLDVCEDYPTTFYNIVCNPGSSAQGMTYMESWDYIKQGCRSLSRYTNVNLLINSYKNLEDQPPSE